MSDAYERAKAGRLSFKGGGLATRSKSIDKKQKKKKHMFKPQDEADLGAVADGQEVEDLSGNDGASGGGGQDIYTIDAAKKKKYEELFPVETKKFGYDPKFKAKNVEDALDDRVKKKADRYCK